jgi:hypothetical protein
MRLDLLCAMSAICGMLALEASPSHGQEGSGTKFRGLFINMSRAEVEALQPSDFDISFEDDAATFQLKGSQKACAIAFFDKAKKVESMKFQRCFFKADDLTLEQFAQRVVDSYNIPNLSCKSDLDDPVMGKLLREYANEGLVARDSRTCTGPASTGEMVTIGTPGILQPAMTVGRRTASQQPKFN